MKKEIYCPFCEKKIPPLEENYTIKGILSCQCGAQYWAEFAEDISASLKNFLLRNPYYRTEGGSFAIWRNYDNFLEDRCQNPKEGIEVVIIFVKKK